MSKKKTLQLAEHLEMIRVVAAIVTGTKVVESAVPTEIFAIGSGKVYQSFSLDTTIAGIFRPGLRNNIIVVRDIAGANENATIMHEYVHFLISSHSGANYPMWFHEGFAEYLSSAQIDKGVVTIGATPDAYMRIFAIAELVRGVNWIHLSRIVGRSGGDVWTPAESALFYAQSWGLVHYLQNREDVDTPFGQQLRTYVSLMNDGQESVSAFEEAFGLDMSDLDKNVSQYLGRNRIPGFRFELDAVVTDFEPETRDLSKEEISLALAQYALSINDLDGAEKWFTIASGDERYRAQAEAGLGDVQKFQGNFEAALPHFEQAIELAPDDPLVRLDMAEYWHDRAEDETEEDLKFEYLANAREHYRVAWRQDSSMPETYAMYGDSFLVGKDDYNKAVGLLQQAQKLLPSNIPIRLHLAEAYLGAGRDEEAATAARSVMAWAHNESEATTRAQEILRSLESEDELSDEQYEEE